MILDSYKLLNVTVQIEYSEAFELWDCAGAISRRLCLIWLDLKVSDAQPHQQTLIGKDLNIQTGLIKSTITLSGEKSLTQTRIQQIKDTFEVWRDELKITELKRASARIQYGKNFNSIRDANAQLFSLKIAKWPETKVFDQPIDSDLNTMELRYRFQDEDSFSTLLIKSEQVIYQASLDPNFVEDYEIKKTINRTIIDFDRGLLGAINANNFRMDEWIKGFMHLLRRDIEKVIKD